MLVAKAFYACQVIDSQHTCPAPEADRAQCCTYSGPLISIAIQLSRD